MNISSKLSDREIISLYINGKESALNVIIKRHRRRIFGFILSKIKAKIIPNARFKPIPPLFLLD